ncbi:HD domain-containing protein [Jiangella asiatica]|uniref:HD/PDEase domain-containing protein n=1 Tax=Jiangella asiatica TaxID=2530372 RepID=A0A4R5CIQ4_9ACTN|nr:HD domain-containing protein [Jiangella asiatica]TDD97252.1 hypothetical protein E1269_29835 [Jiangella asiatica]
MTGSRFEHALGAMHLARQAWQQAWLNSSDDVRKAFRSDVWKTLNGLTASALDQDTRDWVRGHAEFNETFDDRIALAVGAATLLHDIGHAPFSHTLEPFFARHAAQIASQDPTKVAKYVTSMVTPFHEFVGYQMLDQIEPDAVERIPWVVVKMIMDTSHQPGTWQASIHGLISGEVDVDRMDYLVRDGQKSGSEVAAVDLARLIQSVELRNIQSNGDTDAPAVWSVGFGLRARSAIEAFLNNRQRYHQWVLFHSHAVAVDRMLEYAVEGLWTLARDVRQGSRDAELLHVLADLVPDLNYFSPHKRLYDATRDGRPVVIEDHDTTAIQASIDDVTVMEWLKSSASVVRALLTSGQSLGARRAELVRVLACVEALVDRVPNWAPVWKTEDDYREMADELKEPLVATLNSLGLELLRDGRRRVEGLSAAPTAAVSASLDEVSKAFAKDSILGLNLLAKQCLRSRDMTQRFLRERTWADALSTRCVPSRQLKGGFWVFAFQEVASVRDGHEMAVNVFDGNRPRPFREISATVSYLPEIEARAVKLHVYYVCPNLQMRVNRISRYKDELRKLFKEHFADVVMSTYRDLI